MEREQSEGCDRDSQTTITSEYHVFLSFQGRDARLGIVNHLYECMIGAGLRVFKDDEEICHGEEIGEELKRAIHGSRVYAVVFSRNYASSTWCLKELDMMVDLYGGSNIGKKIILPIFYGADPADVELRTELYQEMLDTHKDRHGQEVVKKWEEALKTVGGISGWDCKAIQGEGRFVRLIVQEIVVKLRIKDQSLPDHLTGIDDQVSNMLNLLDCNSSGVRLVVLHGMGGIGKTTLARVIFNKLSSQFEWSSFISNVRESAKGHEGIVKLQNKLSRDILGGRYESCNFADGFDEIIQRIRGRKMLLVLDDVDDFSQLEKLVRKDPEDTLGTGSRVIITTRDKSVCDRFVRPDSELLHFYEMDKMADNHALQLFSGHAFGTDEPPEDYLCLSKQVVETTGNLPLALVVIGAHLFCQSKESWKYELEKLKNVLQKRVFDILKVSYDGLDWMEKEIFLDITCFEENEMPRRYADYLWEARDLYPKAEVKVLINKSLIKIDSDGFFWIHDQLRDMGREIIRSEGNGRLEERTRLWDREGALKIVLQKQVSKKIIAMTLGRHDEAHEFSDENFSGLSNLLFLDLNGTKLIGDFGNIRESLLWLSWWGCNQKLNSNFFKMKSLVVLRINGNEGSKWGADKLMMPNLRVLELRRSDMTTSPDLSCCLKLEILVFFNCFKLEEIHRSVGKLKSLAYMNISWCSCLTSLPKELCFAIALRELIVTKCKIEEVPELIGKLKSLRTLDLECNKIKSLPTSICDMENLTILHASSCRLEEGIPEEIGRLSALEELDLSSSKIRFLPATFSQLTSLKSLYLRGCNMLQEVRGLPTCLTMLNASDCPLDEGIPEEIGRLSALEKLDLSRSNIRSLPATFSQLTSLKSLYLRDCNMLQEVRGLPTSLVVLNASNCPLNEGIPEEIGRLSALEELNLSKSQIRFLPATFSQLTSLKSLRLDGCEMLEEVRGLPTSLTVLDASDCPLDQGIPDEIGSLSALERLDLLNSKICFMPATVSQLTSLKSLRLCSCRMLQEVRGLPTSLMVLNASNCPLNKGIPEEIGRLSALEELDLSRSKIRFLPATVSQLTSLKSLRLDGCDMLEEVRGLPTSLMVLTASNCPLDEGIPEEIGILSALEELDLSGSKIRFLPATVSQLTSLKSLELVGCEMLEEVRGLPTSLIVLDASDCPLDQGIPDEIGSLSALERLDLSGSKIRFLPATVSQLTSLKSLKLDGCEMLEEVRGLPTSLTYFAVSWKTVGLSVEIRRTEKNGVRIISYRGVSELGFLSRLKTLDLSFPGMASLHTYMEISDFTLTEMELGVLDSLPSLTELSINESHSLLRVSNIGRLRGLRSLKFKGCRELVEIPGLEQLELLEELSFHWCPSIRRIQNLLDLKRLKEVGIIGCSSLLCVPRAIDECHLSIDGCDKLDCFRGSYRKYGRKDVSFDALKKIILRFCSPSSEHEEQGC